MENLHKFPYHVSNCPGRFYFKEKIIGCSLCGVELRERLDIMQVNENFEQSEKLTQFASDVLKHFAHRAEFIAINTTE